MIIKKIALTLLACGSNLAFAGAMGPVCDDSNVKTPCSGNAWQIGGQALYLQPSTTLSQINSGVSNLNGQQKNYPQPWSWGFRLEAGHQYGKANDVNINWSHLSNSAQKSIAGPFVIDQLFTQPSSSSVVLDNNPQWDDVNLELGQQLIVTENKTFRFHGGVEYVRLNDTNSRTVTIPITGARYSDKRNSSYNGFGPRVGLDFNYALNHGIAVYVNSAAGLLAGQAKTNFNGYDIVLGAASSTASSASTTRVVPELEGKLGIKYDYALPQGDLTLDAGWLWINYFNAQPEILTAGPSILSQVLNQDFSLQGLYFGLKWNGNIA